MTLDARNIEVRRKNGPRLIFDDFSLSAGERLLLLGPSGSGKTTLLSVLAGLLPPASGHILLGGQDFYGLTPSARDRLRGRKLGFIFQTLHLLPSLSVRDNILLAAKMANIHPEEGRVEHLLESLGLHGKAQRKPSELSQGEQQRVAIARAVLNRPEILIADEPTSALDDANAEIIMNLLEEQARHANAALLVATHDNRILSRFSKTMILKNSVREAA